MAKLFISFWKDYAFKQYISGTYPYFSIAVKNMSFRITPVQGVETTNTGVQFNIQIEKRFKFQDSLEKPLGDGTDGATNIVDRLNAARAIEWITQTTKVSKKREILMRTKLHSYLNHSLENTEARHLASLITNQFIEHEENLMKMTWAHNEVVKETITLKDSDGNVTDKSKNLVMEKIRNAIDKINFTTNEFKHFIDLEKIVVLMHPKFTKMYADLQGQSYQTGTNTFGTGFRAGFRYDGVDYIPSVWFNSIETDSTNGAKKTLAFIVLNKDAVLDAGVDNYSQYLREKFLNETFQGRNYSQLSHIVFPKEIFAFDVLQDEIIPASARVND